MVTNVLSENQNKFITVKFLTKDNEERTYNGRMNVIKGLKGNERGQIAAEALRKAGYITLKTNKGYKCFNQIMGHYEIHICETREDVEASERGEW